MLNSDSLSPVNILADSMLRGPFAMLQANAECPFLTVVQTSGAGEVKNDFSNT